MELQGKMKMNMVMMMKKQSITKINHPSITSSKTLGFHKDSQTISKPKPKIRIIHIFAPEIIKTDVENFRELVQRLTGKPDSDFCNIGKRKKKEEVAKKMEGINGSGFDEQKKTVIRSKNGDGIQNAMMINNNSVSGCVGVGVGGGGFLNGFADLDGFFVQQFTDFSSLLDHTAATNHNQMNVGNF